MEELSEQGTIKINTGEIKGNIKKIINNKYTFLFSLLFVTILLLLILKTYGIGSGTAFLARLFAAFSTQILLLLLLALALSAILAHYRKFKWMFLPIIIWLIITTAIVRTANIDQLKDVTTGDYTLGPDLDPFLYLRHATEMSEGRLQDIDYFRQAPLGVKNYAYTNIMPWTIFYMYKFISVFSDASLTYSAIITPVILFIISLIGFLLFVKTISSFKMSEQQAWITATIASVFYAFIPAMLHRTVAGIPEIESLGMVFFWFAFLFFTLAWKQENKNKQILFGVLAGIFTGAMSWSWGGYRFIYMILSLTILLLFLFEKNREKISVVFSAWIVPALILELLKVKSIIAILMGFSDVGFGAFVWFIILVDFALSKSRLRDAGFLKKINLPDPAKSLLIGLVLAAIIATIISPSFIFNSFSSLIERLLYPFGRARIALTVAENKAPYLTEVLGSFGNLVWLFLLGNILLFHEAIKHFSNKKRLLFNFLFIIFILALTFTRFSPGSIFNGENFISKFA
ncbi:MAG: STT3 domain-containing protein, partial [Nanoarchaeota archaeon]|nr:STT3 domain-containing protein [Nanoarchaeota archaeon]